MLDSLLYSYQASLPRFRVTTSPLAFSYVIMRLTSSIGSYISRHEIEKIPAAKELRHSCILLRYGYHCNFLSESDGKS